MSYDSNVSEIWRFIPGFKSRYGYYRVSSKGRVKNGLGKECAHHKHKKGYVMISLYRDKKEGRYQLHRLVAKAFIPNPDNLPQVNHLDGDKKNNAVSNLQWCTNAQNMAHSWAIGLRKKNEIYTKVAKAIRRLTSEQAEEIRKVKLSKGPNPNGISRKQLADRYGVTEWVIKDIRTNRSYL